MSYRFPNYYSLQAHRNVSLMHYTSPELITIHFILMKFSYLLAISILHQMGLPILGEQPTPAVIRQTWETQSSANHKRWERQNPNYSSLLPQDVDFLSTIFTRLVSVRSFSSVFSTRLARSSIISRKENKDAWLKPSNILVHIKVSELWWSFPVIILPSAVSKGVKNPCMFFENCHSDSKKGEKR